MSISTAPCLFSILQKGCDLAPSRSVMPLFRLRTGYIDHSQKVGLHHGHNHQNAPKRSTLPSARVVVAKRTSRPPAQAPSLTHRVLHGAHSTRSRPHRTVLVCSRHRVLQHRRAVDPHVALAPPSGKESVCPAHPLYRLRTPPSSGCCWTARASGTGC